jgi:hypothetical protein
MKRRPLPKPGDRIHCDPNRDEGDTPRRWSNPSRESARVVAVTRDARAGGWSVITFAVWRRRKQMWRYRAETEFWWHEARRWEIGPLPKPPRRKP